jgi:hypothetical protein
MSENIYGLTNVLLVIPLLIELFFYSFHTIPINKFYISLFEFEISVGLLLFPG